MLLATVRRAGLGALVALAALLSLPHAAHALSWSRCRDFGSVRCTHVAVPLDRSGAMAGTIRLRVARTGRHRGPALMYLSGGPGGAGVSEMVGVMGEVNRLLDRYRVFGYDQRGTGYSGLLRCPELEHDPNLRSTTAGEQCANEIGPKRIHYTTADSVQDMEAIRQALHVRRWTLFGISYGTTLALAYARAYPTHVNRLILDSVADPDDSDPFFQASFHNMAPSLRALCPSHCRRLSADPAADLAKLVAQLRANGSLHAVAYDALGRSHRYAIGPTALLDLMFNADYDPGLRAAMPSAVDAALAGDGAPIARLFQASSIFNDYGSPRDFSDGRYAAVCEETPLPWDPGTPLDQRLAVTNARLAAAGPTAFFPFDAPAVLEDEIDLCLRWPDVPHPRAAIAPPPYPHVPTLILQGGEDLRTPPEVSARVAAEIPGSHRLVVPGVGHAIIGDDFSGCGERALLRFVANRRVPATCPRVPTGVVGVQAPPASFTALKGVRGLPLKVGRTVRALGATIDDILLLYSEVYYYTVSSGGLRGGSWAFHGRKLHLDHYQAVPGVEVTGGGASTARALKRGWRLRITGANAAHGTVVFHAHGRVNGRLGGHRIHGVLGSTATTASAAIASAASTREPLATAARVP
jgi:pimeloyl-ACP methyl ester carboxylesterase